ncbi:hypothetical protein EV714DRAFT_208669 [Schizophyllum commune]
MSTSSTHRRVASPAFFAATPASKAPFSADGDPNTFIRTLRTSPEVEASLGGIAGNVPKANKRICANALAFFVSTPGRSYGADVGRRLKIREMSLSESPPRCEVMLEIEVTRDMCNVYETLHGACAAYIVDPCSVASLIGLGLAVGVDGTGVSQSMNLTWHEPAPLGTTLRIVSTSISIQGRIRTARCEIWDRDCKKLFISAVHSTVKPSSSRGMKL